MWLRDLRKFIERTACQGKWLLITGPCLACLTTMCMVGAVAKAQTFEQKAGALVTSKTLEAIEDGLQYLVLTQTENGAFGDGYGCNVAVVGFAGMAFLANGDMPLGSLEGTTSGFAEDEGGLDPSRLARRRCVDGCLRYILSQAQPNGYLDAGVRGVDSSMYGHGFATLFLTEAYGMANSVELRRTIDQAVERIRASQNEAGGWRYAPERADADISVTVCQIMALRGAKNAGFYVPSSTIRDAVGYVDRCQNPDGGFSYMPSEPRKSAFPRSAAAVVAMFGAGQASPPAIRKSMDYLRMNSSNADHSHEDGYDLYGRYYAAQAWWLADQEGFLQWYAKERDRLLKAQRPNGSWQDAVGPAYATAMGLLILQVPQQQLPIFQR